MSARSLQQPASLLVMMLLMVATRLGAICEGWCGWSMAGVCVCVCELVLSLRACVALSWSEWSCVNSTTAQRIRICRNCSVSAEQTETRDGGYI